MFLANYQTLIDKQLWNLIQQARQQNEENLLRLQEIYHFIEEAYWEIQGKITHGQELSPLETQQKELLTKLADLFSVEIF